MRLKNLNSEKCQKSEKKLKNKVKRVKKVIKNAEISNVKISKNTPLHPEIMQSPIIKPYRRILCC